MALARSGSISLLLNDATEKNTRRHVAIWLLVPAVPFVFLLAGTRVFL